MFMQRIETPPEAPGRRQRALKLGLGLLFVAATLMMMPPYFLALGAWIVGSAVVRISSETVLRHGVLRHADGMAAGS